MKPWVIHWHSHTLVWNHHFLDVFVAVFMVSLLIVSPASALRLQERSIYINNSDAGATTFYRLAYKYMSPDPVGSVEFLFCEDPIPYNPCVTPPGLDASGATLSQQSGETGFSISSRSENRLVMNRTSVAPENPKSVYTFNNIVNPGNSDEAFAVRLKTHTSTNASGPLVDFGSMRAQITQPIEITTQVPPMLIFCLAQEVADNCMSTDEINYSDMGQLAPNQTLTAQSQMAVGTNASAGFAIVANGAPMSAGTNVIDSPGQPVPSRQGENQFGFNLVANTAPDVGNDPEGEWANAIASPEYAQRDRYKFESGDIVAFSPNVSLMKKFTVSYIVNSDEDLRAGVYTTTINFVATGRF